MHENTVAKNLFYSIVIKLETSDWVDFVKALAADGTQCDLILLDGPWGVNSRGRSGGASSRSRSNRLTRDLVLDDVELQEVFHLLRKKVLAPNGMLLSYVGVRDYGRWVDKLESLNFEVCQFPITITFHPNSCYRRTTSATMHNVTHTILQAWRAGEVPARNLEDRGFSSSGSTILARCNWINNYIPPRVTQRTRSITSGEPLRVEEKSVEIFEELIQRFSRPGAVIGDFFLGSGTTIVAAALHGRKVVACDKDPDAVATAKARGLRDILKLYNQGLLTPTMETPIHHVPRKSWAIFEQVLVRKLDLSTGQRSWENIPPYIKLDDGDVQGQETRHLNGLVHIARSTLPNMARGLDMGLFASRPIPKDTPIASYWGTISVYLKSEPAEVLKEHDNFFDVDAMDIGADVLNVLPSVYSLVLKACRGCVARYVNCCRGPGLNAQPDMVKQNCLALSAFQRGSPYCPWFTQLMSQGKYQEILSSDKLIYLVSCRDIEAGEELFFDYGDNYWLGVGSSKEVDDVIGYESD